jgi:hypothetical protein
MAVREAGRRVANADQLITFCNQPRSPPLQAGNWRHDRMPASTVHEEADTWQWQMTSNKRAPR